jgi:hypothetical protein
MVELGARDLEVARALQHELVVQHDVTSSVRLE